MATTAAPTGLRPIGYLGGKPFAGAVTEYRILSGYATAIYNGDVVRIGASGDTTAEGYLVKETGTTTISSPIGVFRGVRYTDPGTGQIVHREYYPGSIVATDIWAKVADDPDTLFQAQGSASITQAELGLNFALVQGSGSTITGQSGVAVNGSSAGATTNTLPLRLVNFVQGPNSTPGDTYTDVVVMITPGLHANSKPLGR